MWKKLIESNYREWQLTAVDHPVKGTPGDTISCMITHALVKVQNFQNPEL